MKALKLFLSGLVVVSMLSGMAVSAFGEEAENQGISIDIREGSEEGSLKETDDGMPVGSSMEMDGLGRGAIGNDEFLNRGEEADEDYTTIEDWNLKVPTPDNSISVLDESTGEFYIYSSGQEGIPYVMIMPFDYSGGGEAFLNDFRDYMTECYADLTVTEEINQTTVGGHVCWQTRYEYSISGYAAHDRRVAIEHNGMIYMFASKEVPELELTVGGLLEDTLSGMSFLDEEDAGPAAGNYGEGEVLLSGGNSDTGGQNLPSANTGNIAMGETAFTMTKIQDENGLTMGRMYAPSDYVVSQHLSSYGDGNSACSPACPMQLVLAADNPNSDSELLYISGMYYIYPQQMYSEGQLYYGISTMLEPMTASAYADRIMLQIYDNVGEITCTGEREISDEEQARLQDRAQQIYDYYNTSFSTNALVNLEGTMSTYAERTYSFEQNGIPYTTIVITATDLTQYTQSMGNYSETMVEMTVPYVYIYCAPSSEADAGRGNFDLFLSNTRVSDEFDLARQKMSLALENAITSGTNANIDDDEISEILGTGDGTYSTEEFCDYILSQNSYTTSEGKVVKIPNSYDYVYEGDNGNIYATNSTDQPAGSTRLNAN